MNTIKWDRVIALGIITGLTIALVVHENEPAEQVKTPRVWTKEDSKAYAKDSLVKWSIKQNGCLGALWGRESAWNHNAINHEKVMGKNAGGIPQLLGLSPLTPPTIQIDRGLEYIYHRYETPCEAWKFHKKNGWY
jgi:hypothetical protein